MRTNKEQIKNFLNGIFFGVFVVGIMFVTTGCPDKSKNNDGRNYDGYYRGGYRYGDRGYNGNGYVEYIGIGANQQNGAELTLEATIEDQANASYSQTYLTGELYIDNEIQCPGGGYIEPGRYDIEPYNGQPTSMSMSAMGALVSSANLEGYGYDDLTIQISTAYFFREALGNYDGLQATVYIPYINGFFCGASFNVTDQGL